MQKKPRLAAIEYIRGISMLGVIGIHTGAFYISNNPAANIHLLAIFEIISRFSVPIFFFISAFGIFYNMTSTFSYGEFLRRRFRAILIPYIAWSVLYMWKNDVLFAGDLSAILQKFLFGTAEMQLYFLVILIWFYLLMPLWIFLVRRITPKGLLLLLAVQIIFNMLSCGSSMYLYTYNLPQDSLAAILLTNRLNYWVMHYMFIFVLGGYLAAHSDEFRRFMTDKPHIATAGFFVTMAMLLGYYYKCIYMDGLTALGAIYTAHQLCPAGVLYTVGASVFFFTLFTVCQFPPTIENLLHLLGKHSYFAYLAHPLMLSVAQNIITKTGIVTSSSIIIVVYFAVVTLSIVAAIATRHIGERYPVINFLTIGISTPSQQKR